MPNAEYLAGNLSNNLLVTGNRNLGTDFAGRAIIQNAIYDPATAVVNSNGQRVLQVFPNNIIPQSRIDPVAAKIMASVPQAEYRQRSVRQQLRRERAISTNCSRFLRSRSTRTLATNSKCPAFLELEDTDQIERRGRSARCSVAGSHPVHREQDRPPEPGLHHLAHTAVPFRRGLSAAPESGYRSAGERRIRQYVARHHRLPRYGISRESAGSATTC